MFGLPTWAINLIGGVLLALLVAGVGAHLASVWYAPQLVAAKTQIKATDTAAKAVKVAQTSITKTDSAAETAAQATIQVQTRTIIKKAPIYVSASPSPPVGCVTNGMLRLHDAAVLGVDPADIHPPAGQPDAACSTTAPSDFMAAVVDNYATARANAEQLNALEVDLDARIEALAPAGK